MPIAVPSVAILAGGCLILLGQHSSPQLIVARCGLLGNFYACPDVASDS
jgi:hypothetical protein